MAIKNIIISDFMPPTTDWGNAPLLPMALGEYITALVKCDDGALLAIQAYDAQRMLTNLKAGTLWSALMMLKAHSTWAYLILYDCPTPGKMATSKADMVEFLDQHNGVVETTGWHWAAYQGCLMSIQELGIIVLMVPTEADIGPAVQALGKRDRANKRVAPLRSLEAITPGEAMLLALPGVGGALALRLLAETGGNVAAALMVATDPFYPFAGLSAKIRQDIRQALGLKQDEAIGLSILEPEAIHE